MKTVLTHLFLKLLIVTAFAQEKIPSTEEVLGSWTVVQEDFNDSVLYLEKTNLLEYTTKRDIKIYQSRYTNTLKIKYQDHLIPKVVRRVPPIPRCGNDRRHYTQKKNPYFKKSLCAYDPKSGFFKVSDPHFFDGKLFTIHKISFKEMRLTRVK